MAHNLRINIEFKLQYFFSISISCLILRIISLLEYHPDIGPLTQIVSKMTADFSNFCILYFLLVIMFGTVGSLNFELELEQFSDYFTSLLSVVNISIGNSKIDDIEEESLRLFGILYNIATSVTFNLIIINFWIAVLADTYS